MPGDGPAGEAPAKQVKKRVSQAGVAAADGATAAHRAREGLPALLQTLQNKQTEHNSGALRAPGTFSVDYFMGAKITSASEFNTFRDGKGKSGAGLKQLEAGAVAGAKREPLNSRVLFFLPHESNLTFREIQKLVDNSRDIVERPQGGVQTFEAGSFTGSMVRGAEGIKTWTATHIPKKEPKTSLAALNALSPPRAKSGDSLAPPPPGSDTHVVLTLKFCLPGTSTGVLAPGVHCRGTSRIRNTPPLGPYSRTMPRVLEWS